MSLMHVLMNIRKKKACYWGVTDACSYDIHKKKKLVI